MAFGKVSVKTVPPGGQIVYPASLTSSWQTIIAAGGITTQDAATIQNPNTQINTSATVTKLSFGRKGFGTTLIARLVYDDGLTTITNPVVKLFGRTGPDEVWTLIKTKSLSLSATLSTTVASDVTDGTFFYTTPDLTSQAWDCTGCDELLLGVETALAATGTVSTAFVQGKFI